MKINNTLVICIYILKIIFNMFFDLLLKSKTTFLMFSTLSKYYSRLFFFMATSEAYGSSQSRGQIRAAATGLHHSHSQHQILYPLNEARDLRHVLMDTSWVCYCWITMGTPKTIIFNSCKVFYNMFIIINLILLNTIVFLLYTFYKWYG